MTKLKLKENLKEEQKPTRGRYYGSGCTLTELLALIDQEVNYRPPRCDCDSHHRCATCRIQTEVAYQRENLKKKCVEIFE